MPFLSSPLVVVVTGASAGVGRAVVRAFARRGASLGLIARGAERLEATRHEVESLGGRAAVAIADVANEGQVELAARSIESELGPIDIWINNAMVSVFSPVERMTPNEYRRVTDVTYLGYVWGTQAALRRMRSARRTTSGVIVQVGSALAYRSIPLQSAYCAAKHAVKGFTESLRTELLHDRSNSKVRLVMVELPAVNTPQFDWSRSKMPRRAKPVPPIYQPDVIAEGIVHAAMHPRRQMVIGWPTMKAIIAEKVAPGMADRYLARHGIDAQMTSDSEDPNRPDNLFAPVRGDRGSHGRFDGCARHSSLQMWASIHRQHLILASIALALLSPIAALAVGRWFGAGTARA